MHKVKLPTKSPSLRQGGVAEESVSLQYDEWSSRPVYGIVKLKRRNKQAEDFLFPGIVHN